MFLKTIVNIKEQILFLFLAEQEIALKRSK